MKTLVPGFLTRWLLSSLLLCLSAAGQTQSPPGTTTKPLPPAAYKLIAVKVTGSKRFTQEEVAAASGLPVGTVAHEDEFKKATTQTGERGGFSDPQCSIT